MEHHQTSTQPTLMQNIIPFYTISIHILTHSKTSLQQCSIKTCDRSRVPAAPPALGRSGGFRGTYGSRSPKSDAKEEASSVGKFCWSALSLSKGLEVAAQCWNGWKLRDVCGWIKYCNWILKRCWLMHCKNAVRKRVELEHKVMGADLPQQSPISYFNIFHCLVILLCRNSKPAICNSKSIFPSHYWAWMSQVCTANDMGLLATFPIIATTCDRTDFHHICLM